MKGRWKNEGGLQCVLYCKYSISIYFYSFTAYWLRLAFILAFGVQARASQLAISNHNYAFGCFGAAIYDTLHYLNDERLK